MFDLNGPIVLWSMSEVKPLLLLYFLSLPHSLFWTPLFTVSIQTICIDIPHLCWSFSDMNPHKASDATSLKKRGFNDFCFLICSVYLCCLLSLFYQCLLKCLWRSSSTIESLRCCCVFHGPPCLTSLLVFTKVNKEDPLSALWIHTVDVSIRRAASGCSVECETLLKELNPLLFRQSSSSVLHLWKGACSQLLFFIPSIKASQ